MNLPKRTLEQTIQRVSQMRRLGLSLREAYEKQFLLPQWLAHFEVLRNLPPEQFPMQFSCHDIDALRAGIRKNWAEGHYSVTSEIFAKKAKKSGSRNRTLTEMNS
jgi:hypothetical protein